MRRKNKYSEVSSSISEMNVTPFIDVMLVLLIIFMITAPVLLSEMNVSLPKSSNAQEIKERDTVSIVITVTMQEEYYLDKKKISLAGLQQEIARLKTESPDMFVYIQGDKQVKYDVIVKLMGMLYKMDLKNVSLITES